MGKRPTRIDFFATAEDLCPLLAAIESKCDLEFVECGLFDHEQRPVYRSLSSSSVLGVALVGDSNREQTYLVGRAPAGFKVRSIAQRRGGTKYAIDQMINPCTVVLRPGGKYCDSAVIAGMVGTVSNDPTSIKLMKAFSDEIKKTFTAVRGNRVGCTALDLLKTGMRLTSDVRTSLEYDLLE